MPGPRLIDLDFNLSHDFPLTKAKKEAKVFTASLNAFNLLNHPNYVNYIGTQSSPLFGKPVAAQPPRRLQLDLIATINRFDFRAAAVDGRVRRFLLQDTTRLGEQNGKEWISPSLRRGLS